MHQSRGHERVRTHYAHHATPHVPLQNFMASRSLADYLGLRRVEALHMPVPLSIVFIGFAGDGNMQVNLSGEELAG